VRTGDEVGMCDRFPRQLCAHICIDTPNSYRCACREGFSLQTDGRTCRQNSSYRLSLVL